MTSPFIHGIAILALAASLPAAAQKVLATGDFSDPQIVAEVIECRRNDEALSVKIRLRNTSDDSRPVTVVSAGNYDQHYVIAKKKKYLMLRDADKRPIAAESNPVGDVGLYIPKGGAWTWWAKFQPPPADVKSIEYIWPVGSPIDDIPCGGS